MLRCRGRLRAVDPALAPFACGVQERRFPAHVRSTRVGRSQSHFTPTNSSWLDLVERWFADDQGDEAQHLTSLAVGVEKPPEERRNGWGEPAPARHGHDAVVDAEGFVVVSGLPASGKSCLAAPLARELGLPLISKDDIKETLGEHLPCEGREGSARLGRAGVEVLWTLASRAPMPYSHPSGTPSSPSRGSSHLAGRSSRSSATRPDSCARSVLSRQNPEPPPRSPGARDPGR